MVENWNKLINIEFDQEIHVVDMLNLHKAFSCNFQERLYYNGDLYTQNIQAVSAQWVNVEHTSIQIMFSDIENFRKAESDINVSYDSSKGAIYGELPKDILPSFTKIFTATNLDQYQNPFTSEIVKATANTSTIVKCNSIITHKEDNNSETVKAIAINNEVCEPILVGQIIP